MGKKIKHILIYMVLLIGIAGCSTKEKDPHQDMALSVVLENKKVDYAECTHKNIDNIKFIGCFIKYKDSGFIGKALFFAEGKKLVSFNGSAKSAITIAERRVKYSDLSIHDTNRIKGKSINITNILKTLEQDLLMMIK